MVSLRGDVAETAGKGMTHRGLLLEHDADEIEDNAIDV